jgi:hypothetical protein
VITLLATIGGCLTPQGKAERAAVLLGAYDALLISIGAQNQNVDQPQVEDYNAEARSSLGDSAFEETWERGNKLSLEEAVALALES